MFKRMEILLEKWGPYLLALLCAAVILLSALWTRREDKMQMDAQALSDDSQRLADVTPTPEPPRLLRPLAGEVVQGYAESAVFFPEVNLWHTHPGVDFAAQAGDKVYAMGNGQVTYAAEGCVELKLDCGFLCRYRGLAEISVQAGQSVRQGAYIGLAGGGVAMEGTERVCVILMQDDEKYVDCLRFIDIS